MYFRSSHTLRAALAAVLILVFLGGCQQYFQKRNRDRAAATKKQETEVFDAFKAEFEPAFDSGNYPAAAAAFTPERETKIKKFGLWTNSQQKFWNRIESRAMQLAKERNYAEALALLALMPTILPGEKMQEEVDETRASIEGQASKTTDDWNAFVAAAESEEKAGRIATAATRLLINRPTPPTPADATNLDARLCKLLTQLGSKHQVKVHATAATGANALLGKMMTSLKKANYLGRVVLVDSAAGADLVVRISLGQETFEKKDTVENRSGTYVSGSRPHANPKIASLKKDIAQLDKDIAWKQKTIANIKCGGECKSRDAHRNDLNRLTERRNDKQKQLSQAPAMVNGPVHEQLSYPVTVSTWTLRQPVIVEGQARGQKAVSKTFDMFRFSRGETHGGVAELRIAAKTAQAPDPATLRPTLEAEIVTAAPYTIYQNLKAANDAVGNKVQSSTGAERAEWIATYMTLNASPSNDEIKFASDEFKKIHNLWGAGNALSTAAKACRAQ